MTKYHLVTKYKEKTECLFWKNCMIGVGRVGGDFFSSSIIDYAWVSFCIKY